LMIDWLVGKTEFNNNSQRKNSVFASTFMAEQYVTQTVPCLKIVTEVPPISDTLISSQ